MQRTVVFDEVASHTKRYLGRMRFFPRPFDDLLRDTALSRGMALLALLGVWLVPALLAAGETVAIARIGGADYPLWRAVAGQGPGWFVYALLTPAILWAALRWPLHERPRVPKLLLHLAGAVAIGGLYALVATTSWRVFSPVTSGAPFGRTALMWWLSALPLATLTYFAVVGAGWAALWFGRHRQSELRAARLSAQLSEARLGALRMQLHPHFLFNSLNAVTVLVRDRDHDRAERVLELLSGLLRSSLRGEGGHRIALEDEVAFIRRYLEIEQVRFSDRLRVNWGIDGGLERALVPAFVLQPLVENAIRHGVARRRDAGQLEIRAARSEDDLLLEVLDDGPGPGEMAGPVARQARDGHVGLANTADRLATLYGDRASIELLARPEGGAVARVRLPLEAVPARAEGAGDTAAVGLAPDDARPAPEARA